jgi:putative membrane protein
MLYLLLTWILSALALFLTSKIVSGFQIPDFKSAMLASIVVGFFNMILRPILLLLTLPINFLTLGLFTFVVNAIVLRVAAGLMKNFKITGWLPAILGAIVLAIINVLLFWIFPPVVYEPVPQV